MATSPVDDLAAALAATGALVASTPADRWGSATPCPEWDVRALVAHLVRGNWLFAAALGGQQPPAPPGDPVQDDAVLDDATSYDDSGRAVVAAFAEPGALERLVTVPFGTVPGAVALHLRTVEALVHGWDLARATGQRLTADDGVVEREIGFTEAALGQLPPDRSPFAPPRPVGADAPPLDRLAALLGRDVGLPR